MAHWFKCEICNMFFYTKEMKNKHDKSKKHLQKVKILLKNNK
jgi:hypothetical protein